MSINSDVVWCLRVRQKDPCSCSFLTREGTSPALIPPTPVDLGTGGRRLCVSDTNRLKSRFIRLGSDVNRCRKMPKDSFLSYVIQTIDMLSTSRQNQIISGFRGNADVGVAALSCYAARRQHGMLGPLRSLLLRR